MCRDAQVFAGTGWTLVRAKATMGEGVGKIREGIGFFNRGVRLLGSDVSSAGRLFYRAGAGASLKPREVRTCVSAQRAHMSVHNISGAGAMMALPGCLMSWWTHRAQQMVCIGAYCTTAICCSDVCARDMEGPGGHHASARLHRHGPHGMSVSMRGILHIVRVNLIAGFCLRNCVPGLAFCQLRLSRSLKIANFALNRGT